MMGMKVNALIIIMFMMGMIVNTIGITMVMISMMAAMALTTSLMFGRWMRQRVPILILMV